MRQGAPVLVLLLIALAAAAPAPPHPGPDLLWAYPSDAASHVALPRGQGPFHVPGSRLAFTRLAVADDANPVDWFPQEHPPPPPVIAHQRPGGPTPCAECHLYNGRGFLGAADLNGLPAAYIAQEVKAFRTGQRRSAEAERFDVLEMIKVARAVSDAELAQAAAYYAALPRTPRLRYVEVAKVPATRPDKFGWLDLVPGGGLEPIGRRVIEVSQDMSLMLLGDDRVDLIDYAPRGAARRGAILAAGGPGRAPCRSCHGPELRGAGEAPPLAGRSAPYLARMLFDIKAGARAGANVARMRPSARVLSDADIADLAAYLASLRP
jgi:cytochrome c553